ncbi:MAG: PASTA domain-containing protein [Ignavibacteriales bacterium]|nr:PASTA domain-containing protein [Ignavibacteriales bacterium]MBK7979685.1 PASTA domain-containing protein [Ignavibacteriota bacterium]
MKESYKKILTIFAIAASFIAILAFIFDVIIMPLYVEGDEIEVPDVIGLSQEEAAEILDDNGLVAAFEGPRYSEKIPKDHVIFQKPEAGSLVKKNRTIHLHISSGNPLKVMPDLVGKSVRDAQITLQRLGFEISEVEQVNSEFSINTVVEQFPISGLNLSNGSKIKLFVSVGPNIGMVRVPDILGMSYKEATSTLETNSLSVGTITYEVSKNLLPNTVISQFPSKNTLVAVGDSIDLFITKSQD